MRCFVDTAASKCTGHLRVKRIQQPLCFPGCGQPPILLFVNWWQEGHCPWVPLGPIWMWNYMKLHDVTPGDDPCYRSRQLVQAWNCQVRPRKGEADRMIWADHGRSAKRWNVWLQGHGKSMEQWDECVRKRIQHESNIPNAARREGAAQQRTKESLIWVWVGTCRKSACITIFARISTSSVQEGFGTTPWDVNSCKTCSAIFISRSYHSKVLFRDLISTVWVAGRRFLTSRKQHFH